MDFWIQLQELFLFLWTINPPFLIQNAFFDIFPFDWKEKKEIKLGLFLKHAIPS